MIFRENKGSSVLLGASPPRMAGLRLRQAGSVLPVEAAFVVKKAPVSPPTPLFRRSLAVLLAALSLVGAFGCSSDPTPVKEAASATGGAATTASGGPKTTAPGGSTGAPATTTKGSMNTATFEIRLTASGATLTAVLHNHSSAPQSVVLKPFLQPSELILTGPKGAVKPFDTREVQKFDATVRQGSFTTIAAGADQALEKATVQGGGGSATLQWGPFRFESLPAGTYTAKVVLKSALTDYEDDQGRSQKKADAWTGTVTSNEVSFQVP